MSFVVKKESFICQGNSLNDNLQGRRQMTFADPAIANREEQGRESFRFDSID
jgi:hypothetical protein